MRSGAGGNVRSGAGRNFEKWSRRELWSLMSGAGGKYVNGVEGKCEKWSRGRVWSESKENCKRREVYRVELVGSVRSGAGWNYEECCWMEL